MMLPIVEAVFQELKRDKELKDEVQHIRLLNKFTVLQCDIFKNCISAVLNLKNSRSQTC